MLFFDFFASFLIRFVNLFFYLCVLDITWRFILSRYDGLWWWSRYYGERLRHNCNIITLINLFLYFFFSELTKGLLCQCLLHALFKTLFQIQLKFLQLFAQDFGLGTYLYSINRRYNHK
jgi:hypothetical protein